MGRRKRFETAVLIKLSDDLLARLRQYAKRQGTTASQAARMALEAFLKGDVKDELRVDPKFLRKKA